MFFRKFLKQKPKEEVVEKIHFTPTGMDELLSFVREYCGIELEPKKEVLYTRLEHFSLRYNISNFYELKEKIIKNSNIMQDFLNLITVNETYFYRELPQLQEAVEFLKSKKNARVLSAPCSSGEEVYSLFILLQNLHVSGAEFVGIDINSLAIKSANEGIYSQRSLHKLDENIKQEYFTCKDEKYYIKHQKIQNVQFKVQNIFDDEILKLGQFDVIFSRNMMIYFDDEFKHKAIKKFHQMLKPYGRLYTGHADLIPKNNLFEKKSIQRLYFYEKI